MAEEAPERVDNPLNSGSDEDPKEDGKTSPAAPPPSGLFAALFAPDLEENEMRQWQAIQQPGVMHPECNFRKWWDLWSMVLIVYSCVTIPYRLGFKADAAGVWEKTEWVIDSCFGIDMCLVFCTACIPQDVMTCDRKEIAVKYFKGWFIPDFFSTFPFDLVLGGGGGGGEGAAMDPGTARILKMIRIARMIKILRMVRIKRLLKKFQDSMSIKNGVMMSIKFTIVVFMASHFIACLFFSFTSGHPDKNWALSYGVWATAENHDPGGSDVCLVNSCRTKALCGDWEGENGYGGAKFSPGYGAGNGIPPNEEHAYPDVLLADPGYVFERNTGNKPGNAPFDSNGDGILDAHSYNATYIAENFGSCDPMEWKKCSRCDGKVMYVASVYYALVTMTTIGYGDILPRNTSERCFCTIAMLIGASIFAYAITNMCTVVHNLNPSDVVAKTRMDDLTDYSNFLGGSDGVPKVIKRRIMEYYFFKMNRSNVCHYNEGEIYKDMSVNMKFDIRWVTTKKSIESVPFLAGFLPEDGGNPMNQRFCSFLATRLTTEAYAPKDFLCKQGNEATAMYVITKGAAKVIKNGQEVDTILDGGLVCSAVLFRKLRHGFSALMHDFSDVFKITPEDFEAACDDAGFSVAEIEKGAIELGLGFDDDDTDYTLGRSDPDNSKKIVKTAAAKEARCLSEIERLSTKIEMQEQYIKMVRDSLLSG